MSVAIGHYSPVAGRFVVPGDTAVQVFFAISGFYMALVLNEKYVDSYGSFLANRALRLLPLYWITVALSVALQPLNAQAWEALATQGLPAIVYVALSQVFLIGQDAVNFLHLPNGMAYYELSPVPQAWTLGLEVLFYLIAPFIVRRPVGLVFALLVVSIAVRLLLQFALGLYGDPWSYRFFPSELALFLSGVIGYKVYSAASPQQKMAAIRILGVSVAAISVALLVNRWNGAMRVVSVAFLTASLLAIPLLFRMTRNLRWDNYIGNLSYPVYILHLLIAHLIPGNFLLYVVSVLAASVAAYHLVDEPVDAWRHRRTLKLRHATAQTLQSTG